MSSANRTTGLLLVLVLLSSCMAFACSVVVIRETAKVSRHVVVGLSYEGTPVKDIELSVVEKSTGKLVQKVTTDAHGSTHIENLVPGAYTIKSPVSDDKEIIVSDEEEASTLQISAFLERRPMRLASFKAIITDPTGAVVPGAVVVLETLDGVTPIAAGTTDSAGRIKLDLRPGTYRMRVGVQGFKTPSVPVQIANDGWPSFRLQLVLGGCPSGDPNQEWLFKPGE